MRSLSTVLQLGSWYVNAEQIGEWGGGGGGRGHADVEKMNLNDIHHHVSEIYVCLQGWSFESSRVHCEYVALIILYSTVLSLCVLHISYDKPQSHHTRIGITLHYIM